MQRLWMARGRFREGLAEFEAVFTDERYHDGDVAPALWVRAVADAAVLAVWVSVPASLQQAEEALAAARNLDDQGHIVRSLMGCGMLGFFNPEVAGPYLAAATALARATGDRLALCHLLGYQTFVGCVAGEPIAATGVDYASSGWITHSAPNLDVALDIEM